MAAALPAAAAFAPAIASASVAAAFAPAVASALVAAALPAAAAFAPAVASASVAAALKGKTCRLTMHYSKVCVLQSRSDLGLSHR